MIERLCRVPGRHRLTLGWWAFNLGAVAALLAFAMRGT